MPLSPDPQYMELSIRGESASRERKMIKLRPYQQEAIRNVLRDWNEGYTDVLGTAATGSGKAQPLDAKVLTPAGWRRMGDLKIGDQVIGSDGKPHRVLGVFPQGRKDIWRVTFSDGAATECCADHLWAVQTKSHKHRGQGFTVKPLRNLMGDLVDGSGANKWFVPLVAPVELEERAVPIDPYALGALLGDGHLQQTLEDNGSVHVASVRFATVDTWLRDEVEHRLGDMGYLKHVSGCDYHVTDGKRNGRAGMTLLNHLRDLGLMGRVSHEKFVPDLYKYNSVAVRLAVLQGLMDTDGSVSPTKAPVFCSTSRQMADDVCEIVRSLGGATRVRRRRVRGGRDAYRVTISLPMNPFRLPRKAALWNPNPKQGRTRAIVGMERVGSAECQCILVDAPDHLYVTDDYVVTHNTCIFLALMKAVLDEQPNKRWLILAHRKELIEQPIERLQQFFPMLALKAGIVMANHDECEQQIIVATVQTLSSEKRLERVLQYGAFDYMITDEAHHSCAQTYLDLYERLREANPELKHLGVTATPIRADGQGLRTVFQTESFHYGIREMVKMGYLVPPRWLAIQTGISLKGVASRGGDFVGKQLANVYETQNCFDLVVESHRKYADGRQCIAFVESVDGAYRLAETFCDAGIAAEAADGTTRKGDREDILKRFRKGETQVLCNVGLYTEGLDVPQVSCIHQVRPTKSDGLYCLDLDTEVLTPDGWKRYNEVAVGGTVAAWDQRDGSIHWVPALAKIVRLLYEGERMYALDTPTLDIRMSGGHRMIYRNKNARARWMVTTAEELAKRNSMYHLPVAGHQDACGVPLSDDELRLIGWFITDGTISKANNQLSIMQSEHQKEHCAHIEAVLQGCGLKYGVYRRKYPQDHDMNASSASTRFYVSKGKPRGTDKHLSGWAHLEPYLDKDLSPLLDELTERQLAVLLETLHLGDGSKQNGQTWTRRSYHISTGNRVFAERLQSLCVRRGWRCNVAYLTNVNGNPLYLIHIKRGDRRAVGGLGEHRTDGRGCLQESPAMPDERVWCVETPLGTLVTRRNGKVAILGNCQMVGRALRPVPGKEDALILDYAPIEARNVCMLGDVLGVEIRKEAYIEEAEEPGEVIAGMTFDGEEKWLEGNPAEIISRQLDYLELSPFSWNRADGDGWMSLGLGEGSDGIERTLVVSPPDGDGFVCLYTVARDRVSRRNDVEIVERGNFEHVAEVADTLIDRYANAVLAKRNVKWRK